MSQRTTKIDITSYIKTKSDRDNFVALLSSFESAVYGIESLEDFLNKSFSLSQREVLLKWFEAKGLRLDEKNYLAKEVRSLISSLESLPVVELVLAVEPSFDIISSVSNILRSKLGSSTLFDYKVDPSIVGGAVVILNGKYIDLSIRKKVLPLLS